MHVCFLAFPAGIVQLSSFRADYGGCLHCRKSTGDARVRNTSVKLE